MRPIALGLILVFCVSCVGPPFRSSRDQPPGVLRWDATLEERAQAVIEPLLEAAEFSYLTGEGDDLRVPVWLVPIRDESGANRATESLDAALYAALLESGRCRVLRVDSEETSVPMISTTSGAVKVGSELSARVVVYGTLRRVAERSQESLLELGGSPSDPCWSLELAAVDVERGEAFWEGAGEFLRVPQATQP